MSNEARVIELIAELDKLSNQVHAIAESLVRGDPNIITDSDMDSLQVIVYALNALRPIC